MKKKHFSLEWTLLATSGIFFILGRFIAPEYEAKLLEIGFYEEVVPVSKYALILSGILLACFVLFRVMRFFRKKA
ncbi:MAG: hypothetical protein ACJAVK_002189 [Akkermansiaceae bacterium]|jgi:hypothetical protein